MRAQTADAKLALDDTEGSGEVTAANPTPPRVDLAMLPTPLQRLDRLSEEVGGPAIWVKRDDLTEGVAGGNKLRKLEFSVGQALADGADVLITAGAKQSNHCRQTAFAAARFGLRCHLLLAGKPPSSALDGNLLLDDLMGAEITYVTPEEFEHLPELFDQLSDRYRRQGNEPYCIPVGASDEVGLWGYIDCSRELGVDFNRLGMKPSHIVTAIGSAGTLGGLLAGAELHDLDAEMVGISVSRPAAYIEEAVDHMLDRWRQRYGLGLDRGGATSNLLDGYIAPGYGKALPQVYETIRRVASLEGLVLDPVYTGKAFDALLNEIRIGRFDDRDEVVFLHTGGIYSLFPHRKRFAAPTEG